ncbi:MAG: dihydrodipicolinate reductase C-terminal domain-containing protein [Candidatus Limnocylindria bacterium]
MGLALAGAVAGRDEHVELLGRPPARGHPAERLTGADVVFEASIGTAVRVNLAAALSAGCRSIVIATTGWEAERQAVDDDLRSTAAAAVWAPNFSLGTALFGRLVDRATALYGRIEAFDPFIVEWHRRAKRDRPSGTALDLARRLGVEALEVTSVRAGSSPGMHLVGFDAPGETVELRITARDRSSYAAGALAAADWLLREPRAPGLHPFDSVVDDLVADALSSADLGAYELPVASRSCRGRHPEWSVRCDSAQDRAPACGRAAAIPYLGSGKGSHMESSPFVTPQRAAVIHDREVVRLEVSTGVRPKPISGAILVFYRLPRRLSRARRRSSGSARGHRVRERRLAGPFGAVVAMYRGGQRCTDVERDANQLL